jgi:carbon-monoxide dehydrogenase large subunit
VLSSSAVTRSYAGVRRSCGKQGRYLGIGLSTYVEICGFGPSAATVGVTGSVAFTESAQVRVLPTGSVAVFTGAHAHGQGHDTTFAQIAADGLGLPLELIHLRHGDRAQGPAMACGTYGSRSLAVGGMAVHKACREVVSKARKLAAHLFEAAEEDMVFEVAKHGTAPVEGVATLPTKSPGCGWATAHFGAMPCGMVLCGHVSTMNGPRFRRRRQSASVL